MGRQVASEAPRHVPEGKTVTTEEKTAAGDAATRAGQGQGGKNAGGMQ